MSKIGRRIYYELATGNVIADTGERQGDVVETQPSDDMQSFSELKGRVLGTDTDYIELNYGDRAAEFANLGSMHVDPAMKILTIYPHVTITVDKAQITANGIDTATVTVSVSDTTTTDPVTFSVNGGVGTNVAFANGKASFTFTTQVAGAYTINATTQKYGSGTIQVQGV